MADRKSYFSLQESWPMVLLLGVMAVGILIWWNRRGGLQEEGISLNSSETASTNEALEEPKPEAPITPEVLSQKGAVVEPSKKPLTIQVHSFQDQAKAQKALEDLRKQGFSGYIIKRDLKEKGIWYRVCVGEFETKQQAEEALTKLKEKYKDSFVIAR